VKRFKIITRVKSASDQKMKRSGAVIVRFTQHNGRSRAVLAGQQEVDGTHPIFLSADIHSSASMRYLSYRVST
jgi:hypothetical protein